MTRDAELDHLKAAQDVAFQRKQDAYQAQQRAWEKLSIARESMNRAHEAKQRAYAEQDRTWQYYQSVRNSNGPLIDSLNAQQESAFQNMKRAYEAASSAYDRRDGAAASAYALEGRGYKEQAQRYVSERRRLVEEIKSARQIHEASKPAFQQAKDEFGAAKRNFDQAKAEHSRAQADFKLAKANFDQAVSSFRSRLEKVKSETKKLNEDRRELAKKAGVPYQYLDKVWVSVKSDGSVNIYFGGVGEPGGPGHGHYALDATGNVTYRRDPFDPHGSHNFIDSTRDYEDVVMGESSSGDFGFMCRFRGYDAYVETNINMDGEHKIDIYYGPNGPLGEGHHHAGALRADPLNIIFDELR